MRGALSVGVHSSQLQAVSVCVLQAEERVVVVVVVVMVVVVSFRFILFLPVILPLHIAFLLCCSYKDLRPRAGARCVRLHLCPACALLC